VLTDESGSLFVVVGAVLLGAVESPFNVEVAIEGIVDGVIVVADDDDEEVFAVFGLILDK
jgi:hypothetical protein